MASAHLGDGSATAAALGAQPASPVPSDLTGWASLAVLAAWLVVSLALGYRRFARADP